MTDAITSALKGTPYLVEPGVAQGIHGRLAALDERIGLLRARGTLTPDTLRRYYGQTRFQQVAESNAIEGSTLSPGETELAIVKGVTLISGHDPKYVRDAHALDSALRKIVDMAGQPGPTSRYDTHDLHQLIMGGGAEQRSFRRVPVRLTGSVHVPPPDFDAVVRQMDEWGAWSGDHAAAHWMIRAAVLHAWFVHIHPFEDGNGRTARALANLEVIRSGAPPLIIRKVQDKDRYLDALSRSDAGDLGPFLDLLLEREEAALAGLEGAAREVEGYDVNAERIRRHQAARLQVWNSAIQLLQSMIAEQFGRLTVSSGGDFDVRPYARELSLDEYLQLCTGHAVSRTWAFEIRARAPALGERSYLAWMGYRSTQVQGLHDKVAGHGPSLLWSRPNTGGFPPWTAVTETDALGLQECTIEAGNGDRWYVRRGTELRVLSTYDLARTIVDGVVAALA
ncbi:MAG: Fic family protein [Deltaproteobacteria bacterium]|nr:Fic family protein [Deltaproteobacteria bacterium]